MTGIVIYQFPEAANSLQYVEGAHLRKGSIWNLSGANFRVAVARNFDV